MTSADAGAVLDELVVELVELVQPGTVVLVVTVFDVVTVLVVTVLVVTVLVVIVIAGTVIGTETNTGAALQLAIVSDAQSLANKLLMRPNSL